MEDKIYTEKEAFDLNRAEQIKILHSREIDISSSSREKTLVRKILESNPEPVIEEESEEPVIKIEEKTEIKIIEKVFMACHKCDGELIHTGGGPSGKDYKCNKCNCGRTQ